MINDMNILQKAYNAIKAKIEFAFFKRKFNNWCETKEIEILNDINKQNNRIVDCLIEENFGCAYYKYVSIIQQKEELKRLSDFKNFILNKSNETDEH